MRICHLQTKVMKYWVSKTITSRKPLTPKMMNEELTSLKQVVSGVLSSHRAYDDYEFIDKVKYLVDRIYLAATLAQK